MGDGFRFGGGSQLAFGSSLEVYSSTLCRTKRCLELTETGLPGDLRRHYALMSSWCMKQFITCFKEYGILYIYPLKLIILFYCKQSVQRRRDNLRGVTQSDITEWDCYANLLSPGSQSQAGGQRYRPGANYQYILRYSNKLCFGKL